MATYPLRCAPNAFLQVYACKGIGYFENQKAYVVSWSATSLSVLTPIDLTVGRKDALVYINRKNIVCRDKIPPSLLPSDNYERFWKTQQVHARWKTLSMCVAEVHAIQDAESVRAGVSERLNQFLK
jgi:hypothetical protein